MAKKQKTKKRRRQSRFTTMLLMLLAIAVLGVATLLLRHSYMQSQNAPSAPSEQEEKPSMFAVKEITVSGNTRYLPEAIVQESGLYEGISIWTADKAAAEQKVLAAFPYIEEVKVSNTAYNKLNIAVTETKELGVMYGDGMWLSVGTNGKVLHQEPVEDDRPFRKMYLKGVTLQSSKIGDMAMAERDFEIINTLMDAFEQYKLDGICEIDLTNKSDIRLNRYNRLTIKLGNDSNLVHEIGVAVSALPDIELQYGAEAKGQLDISSFSEENAENRAVYTPAELLTTAATTTTEPETTGTTAANSEN